MRSQVFSSVFSVLVLSSCVLQGYTLPQQRYTVEEYGRQFSGDEYARKLGNDPIDNLSNEIDGDDTSVKAKEEGSLLSTVLELAMKFLPILMEAMGGDPVDRKDSNGDLADSGDDKLSVKSLALLGLKLFLTVLGGSGSQERVDDDGSLVQPVMRAVIGHLIDSDDPSEVDSMAKQATEVINLVVTLVEALTTSMSQRSFGRSFTAQDYGDYGQDYANDYSY